MRKRLMCLAQAMIMAFSIVACGGSGDTSKNEAVETKYGTINDGELVVAMECAYAPYNWSQSDETNDAVSIMDSSDFANGYDVMMAKKIADDLGLKLNIKRLDWDGLIPALQSGTVDCVIAGQSITPERAEVVDFTKPYYYASIVTICKKDSEYAEAVSLNDLSGAKGTSQINTIWYNTCLPQIPEIDKLPAKKTAPQMLVALESGECDIAVSDIPTAKAAVHVYPDLKILDFTDTEGNYEVDASDINIGCSVKKGNEKLRDAMNTVLEKLDKSDFDEIMDRAIEIQPANN